MPEKGTVKTLRNRLTELTERVREHEGLVRALQAGEVDAVVVLEEDGATIARLQSDEPLYRTIVDTLPQSVATVLSDGTIVYLNRQLATMIGLPAEKLLGGNLLDYVVAEDHGRLSLLLQQALISAQDEAISFRWATGDAPGAVSALRLPISGVDTVGLVIVDIRDQVARQAAEEASRAKDELLASVSHELRTPLTAVAGWVQLLEMDLAREPRAADTLRNLKNAAMSLTKIVDDLLDLSRASRGVLSLAMMEFDIRDCVRMAASFVRSQAEGKAITLHVEVPESPLKVYGDPDRLRQVILNLASNAVKFTDHRGSVELRARKDDGAVVVDVIDSGMGILPEFLPFVFEPFRRAARASGYPGLGIGLAISRQLVEAHGGAISVSSEGPNRGATFTVRLPLVHV